MNSHQGLYQEFRLSRVVKSRAILILLLLGLVRSPLLSSANPVALLVEPGLPFTEDFDTVALRDADLTSADWSVVESALILAPTSPLTNTFGSETTGTPISDEIEPTRAVALGDMDGDGDLDLVVANCMRPNELYLNNGTSDPFSGVISSTISSDTDTTKALALGDVDNDGDLDMIAANGEIRTKLYLNNGSDDPFAGVEGREVAPDSHYTKAAILADMDQDGDLDLVLANKDHSNKLYLNDGSVEPFHDLEGIDIGGERPADPTYSLAVGDLDSDGDMDVVVGNGTDDGTGFLNRYYLNFGTTVPQYPITGTVISSDTTQTRALALGDMNGDGHLDLVTGNDAQANRLYLNNGSSEPFSNITYTLITTATHHTWSVAVGDVDRDGDLDLIAGNDGESKSGTGPREGELNILYLNTGTADPFAGVEGEPISDDADLTVGIALGDVDGDNDLDLVAGNDDVAVNEPPMFNMLYLNQGSPTGTSTDAPPYYAGPAQAASTRVDDESRPITRASLTPTVSLPVNTRIIYYLSSDGGQHWYHVRPGQPFAFPSPGTDLRWRAALHTLSPAQTPRLEALIIRREYWTYRLPIIFAATP